MNEPASRDSLCRQCGIQWLRPTKRSVALDLAAWKLNVGAGQQAMLPLMWHAPDWQVVSKERAGVVAKDVASTGVIVAALESEIGSGVATESRLLPYRADRYGIQVADFDQAKIVDLRLAVSARDGFPVRYNAGHLRRWGSLPEKIGPSAMIDASSWPGDVPTPNDLGRKVNQLRRVGGGEKAIWVTIDLLAADALKSAMIAAAPDGIVLEARGRDVRSIRDGVRRVRQWGERGQVPWKLAISADLVRVEDVVWMWALGADCVAIDAFLEHDFSAEEEAPVPAQATVESSFFFSGAAATPPPKLDRRLSPKIVALVEAAQSLVGQLGCCSPFDSHLSAAFREG